MSFTYFKLVLEKYGIIGYLPFIHNNAIRHVIETDFTNVLSQAYLNSLLGHYIDSIDIFSPNSTSKGLFIKTVEKTFNKFTSKLNIKVVKI